MTASPPPTESPAPDAPPRAEFTHPFRHYQSLALDAFEARPSDRRRCYVVMPVIAVLARRKALTRRVSWL